MLCDSDLGFLNYLIMAALISSNVGLLVLENFMNHVRARSQKEVMSCAARTSRSVIFFTFQTASHKNQNCVGYSDPVPLKMGSLMSSSRWAMVVLGGLGGGQDVDGGGFTGAD